MSENENAIINSERCNTDVYNHGESLGLHDMSKLEAENFCIRETGKTGDLHDWHWVAGRVHLKKLKCFSCQVVINP